ncbi:MAG: hypothetical protein ACRDRK_19745 [Pseudonocardia sp.]
MFDPVGPLPAGVYWRRRWLALGSVVAMLVLVGWPIAGVSTAAESEPTSRPAAWVAVSAPEPVASPSPVVMAAPVAPLSAAGPPAPAAVDPGRTPVPCDDEMLGVVAGVDRVEHRVGERPELSLVVTNISGQPCVRDLGSTRLEVVVWSGDGVTRLWSSNDCVNPSRPEMRTLAPGQPETFPVTWAGRTSTPGCAQQRTVVPAGGYRVLTRVDGVISRPTPFLRSAAAA